MSVVNPIKYTKYDQIIPDGVLPIIEVISEGVGYGTIEMRLPLVTCSVTVKMYKRIP